MNMNLTKENVEYFWKVLNSGSSTEEKKVADEYLRQFKVSNIIYKKIDLKFKTFNF
jgi:hypothetical protein